ncbi:MAG: tungsten ABC transporter substrate-binding protein [Candidatus Lokiarchaeota archaeon]|nr:tungsten ABC transporter substrate-binding protein [Candidatus Lokiarchaeota archaeon]
MEKKLKAVVIIGIVGAAAAIAITAGIMLYPVPVLRLSTTTSVNDSGLMNILIPDFETRFKCDIRLTPKGTGAAIADGSNGDADLILVHSRTSELAFVAAGNGTRRACFMYNDYIVVGPNSDPCGIDGMTNVTKAFTYLHDNLTLSSNPVTGPCWVSRNDSSGTHTKEKSIWALAPPHKSSGSIITGESWYVCANNGMGATLTMTYEKHGYTLSDRATWYAYEATIGGDMKILVQNDPSSTLINPYSFILVNATKYPETNLDLAQKFVAFCLSPYGLAKIEAYQQNGHSLFTICWNNTAPYDVCNSLTDDLNFWNAKVTEYGMNTLL